MQLLKFVDNHVCLMIKHLKSLNESEAWLLDDILMTTAENMNRGVIKECTALVWWAKKQEYNKNFRKWKGLPKSVEIINKQYSYLDPLHLLALLNKPTNYFLFD